MMEYTLFGESHGKAVGIVLRQVPAGLPVDEELLRMDLLRRKAGGGLTTARREPDKVEFLSGVFQGKTTGDTLVAIIPNTDARSADYDALRHTARPGHGDYTAYVRSHGHNDYRGGGHLSGRLTAPLVVGGVLAKSLLAQHGITIRADIVEEENLRRRAEAAKRQGDSVGGQIRCTVSGVPAGWGGGDYTDAVESEISRHIFAIPAVKALGFGAGEDFAAMRGSEANDPLRTDGTHIYTVTNHAGGINGGITNGMDIVFTVTFRPTPSIAQRQDTVDFSAMENTTLSVPGRHDACVVLRAAPAVEAAAALALSGLIPAEGNDLPSYREELDAIDQQLVALFTRRMEIAEDIGAYKKEHGLPVQDTARETKVLRQRGAMSPDYVNQVRELYQVIFRLSREVQER